MDADHPAQRELEELAASSGWVHGLARRLADDEHAAEDLVQEAWVAVLVAPRRVRGRLEAWLAGVVRNLARSDRRAGGRRRAREQRGARPLALPSSHESVEKLEQQRLLIEAVLELDEPYRSAILARYVEGVPPRRMADQRGVPVATVQSRLNRALEQLRAKLVARHGGDARRWLAAFAPLFATGTTRTQTLSAGALLMHSKLTTAAVLVALAAFFAWYAQVDLRSPGARGATTAVLESAALERASASPRAGPGAPGSEGHLAAPPQFAGVSSSRRPQQGPAGPSAAASSIDVPLVVDGERIPELEIRRFLVYGVGRALLEVRKLEILTEQERERRAALGVAAGEPTDEEVRAACEREIAGFAERYPTLDAETEIRRAYASRAQYERRQRQTLAFDALFFPDDPRDRPDVTQDVIRELGAVAAVPASGEDEMVRALLRDRVVAALEARVDVRTARHGLPAELAMVVEGSGFRREVATDEIFAEIRDAVSAADVADAKRFLALNRAAADRLEALGVLVPEEEHRARVRELEDRRPREQAGFDLEYMALQGHGFPSVEAYADYLRLADSFRATREAELQPLADGSLAPALRGHLAVANQVLGLARADTEVLFVSAFDFLNFRWKEDGWEWARLEARRLKQELDAHLDALERGTTPDLQPFDELWSEMLDFHSEFWDPPLPATGRPPAQVGMKRKGHFGPNTRNDLERALGESPYRQLLTNDSIADRVFLEMTPGAVAGPFRGPQGYSIVYLRGRTAPTNPLRPGEPTHVELLREDYLRRELVAFAHRALAEARVEGLD